MLDEESDDELPGVFPHPTGDASVFALLGGVQATFYEGDMSTSRAAHRRVAELQRGPIYPGHAWIFFPAEHTQREIDYLASETTETKMGFENAELAKAIARSVVQRVANELLWGAPYLVQPAFEAVGVMQRCGLEGRLGGEPIPAGPIVPSAA